jgi:hypothetical protein
MTEIPSWARDVPSYSRARGELPAPQWDEVSQNSLDEMRSKLRESILQAILLALKGFFIPGPVGAAFDQLAQWSDDLAQAVTGIPVIGDIVEVFTGIEDGDLNDLGTWVNNLDENIADFVERTVGIGPGMISDATVGSHATNLLLNARFDTADTVATEGGWEWDGTEGKTVAGSAKATAAAADRIMLSNRILVGPGDTLDISVWAKCSSLTYSATNPIILAVTRYDSAMTLLGSTDVVPWVSPAATEPWTQLAGTYPVPAGTGYLRLALKVMNNATAGSVWFDEASATKTGGVKDASIPGIGLILSNVMLGLEDLTGVDINHDGALGAYQSAAAAARANASAISYLQSVINNGTSAVDDFERDDNNTMGSALWDQTYSGSGAGYMETDGHAVTWDPSGSGQRSCIARYIGTPSVSNTDNQRIVAVLGSKGQNNSFYSKCGYNYLFARMNSTSTHYIRATFGADGEVAIGYAIGSGYVQMVTTDVSPPGMGAALRLDCGKSGDSLWYCAYINDAPIIVWDENNASPVTSLGASYRGWGCGMLSEGGFLLGQQLPAKFNSWAAWDV